MRELLLAPFLSAVIVLATTGAFERWLRGKSLKREVRVDTPETHQAKQGTPSMGGVVVCLALAAGCLAARPTMKCLVLVVATLSFACLGFWDDFVKATARPGLGLKARYKFLLQVALAALAAGALSGAFGLESALHLTPSLGEVPVGGAYALAAVVVVVATSNAANIVDGLDGLAAGVLGLCFGALAVFAGVEGAVEVTAFASACAAACLAFLWFNRHPARLWMGDTGSLALGAALALAALASQKALLLPLLGIVLVVDALSVVLQVASFQTTGKRIFRIAPLHHAFELRGWSEPRVVAAAWLLTGVGAAGAAAVWLAGRAP